MNYDAIFDTLTARQSDVMGRLAMDDASALGDAESVAVLVRLRLIETDNIGLRYHMPIAVHMAWCAWCSEHWTDEAEA